MADSKFRVIIVGGGVAGLTLANALEKGQIDYILLESRDEIAAYVGASIAITSNGGRILDQLQCYEPIVENTVPMDDIITWKDGKIIEYNDACRFNRERTGYGFNFMDRHFLLQTLYNGLADKSRIITGKRVLRVDHSRDGVSVQCRDGETYSGDVVIGADGVHSIVRNEMWRHMSISEPTIPLEKDRKALSSTYACMYGVSSPTEHLETGLLNFVLDEKVSFLHSLHKSGRVFWFVFWQLEKTFNVPDIPKFDLQDAEKLAEKCFSIPMTDKLTFKDLWDTRESATLAPLEEGWYDNWTWGRIACIGDAIHKWTPNIGQGGNNAIESAAAIANELRKLAHNKSFSTKPNHEDIVQGFKAYHTHRKARAEFIYEMANTVTRLQALKGPMEKLISLWISPWTGDWVANMQGQNIIGSERIEYLPEPERSFIGTAPFNQNYGPGKEPSMLRRAIIALPLLPLAILCKIMFNRILSAPGLISQAETIMSNNIIDFGTGQTWNIPKLPEPFPFLTTLFSPSLLGIDENQRLQSLTFLTDFASVYLIWILEGHRRANVTRFVYFPMVFGLASQLLGVGCVGPIYYFLHYVQTSLNDYAIPDYRLVNMAAVRTAVLAIISLVAIPGVAMYTYPDLDLRLRINAFWQPFPVFVSIFHFILKKTLVKDTTTEDRMYNVTADIPYIRFSIRTMALISALTFNYVRYTSSASSPTLFLPTWNTVTSTFSSTTATDLDAVSGMALFLQLDWISFSTSAFIWLGLWIWDMKDAGLVRDNESWNKIIICAVAGSYIAGPGATILMGWLWKEEILAHRRARGACLRPVEMKAANGSVKA